MIPSVPANKPWRQALIYTVIMLLFPILGSAISLNLKASDEVSHLIIGIAFYIAVITGLWLARKQGADSKDMGWQSPVKDWGRRLIWLIPLLLIEGASLTTGLQPELTPLKVVSLLFFTIAVGMAEEVFFRGLVLGSLTKLSWPTGLIGSGILFGLAHLANLAGGADPLMTFIQVLFAFVFGVTAGLLVLRSQSLLFPVLWHIVHNTVEMLRVQAGPEKELRLLLIQMPLMILFTIFLWRQQKRSKE